MATVSSATASASWHMPQIAPASNGAFTRGRLGILGLICGSVLACFQSSWRLSEGREQNLAVESWLQGKEQEEWETESLLSTQELWRKDQAASKVTREELSPAKEAEPKKWSPATRGAQSIHARVNVQVRATVSPNFAQPEQLHVQTITFFCRPMMEPLLRAEFPKGRAGPSTRVVHK